MSGLTAGSVPPRDGRYLVVDTVYRGGAPGSCRAGLGGWIRGVGLGRDAVLGWWPLPEMAAWTPASQRPPIRPAPGPGTSQTRKTQVLRRR